MVHIGPLRLPGSENLPNHMTINWAVATESGPIVCFLSCPVAQVLQFWSGGSRWRISLVLLRGSGSQPVELTRQTSPKQPTGDQMRLSWSCSGIRESIFALSMCLGVWQGHVTGARRYLKDACVLVATQLPGKGLGRH